MIPHRSRLTLVAVLSALAMSTHVLSARLDVKVEFDKTFDFKASRTWGWDAEKRGDVKMARTRYDDPDAMRARAEPIIVDTVTTEMARRGLQPASPPDLVVTYYLLMTTSLSAQTLGQFLPAVSAWGLPPFEGATQSLEMMNRGSLVLDLSAKGQVVWRGVAQANIKVDADDRKRENLIREAVRKLLAKYPARR